MGRTFYSFEEYDKALDKAISDAMQSPNGKIQTNAKQALVKSAEENVYSYPTQFYHPEHGDGRRRGNGGILDPKTYSSRRHSETAVIQKNVGKGFTLYLVADAPWQQLFGGSPSDNPDTLGDAIEKNGIYGAPARPWMEEGGNEYAQKQFGKDLVEELEGAGL